VIADWDRPAGPIELPWRPQPPTAPHGGATHLQGRWVVNRIVYRLARAGVDLDPGKCWPWPGAKSEAGYGRLASDPLGDTYVHRVMYREVRGPIPSDQEVDHLCRNRSCANPNPSHMEAVPRAENARRRRTENVSDGMCPAGHLFVPRPNGVRQCHTCHKDYHRAYNRAYRARRTADGNPVK
jgi:hypothetical protein